MNEIKFKYQTNFLEKTLLSTGETIREPYGTLVIDSIETQADAAVKGGSESLIKAYVDKNWKIIIKTNLISWGTPIYIIVQSQNTE